MVEYNLNKAIDTNNTFGYRLGDFRGYNHIAIPSYYMDSWQIASTNTTAGFEVGINISTANGVTNAELKTALGWTNLYFGVRLVCGATTVYKNQLAGDSGFGIGFTVTDSVFNGYTGTCSWSGFICEGSVPLTNSLTGGQQAFETVILPSTSPYTNSGSFTITATPPDPQVVFDIDFDVIEAGIESITGTIVEASDIVNYTVVNTSGSGIDLEFNLTKTPSGSGGPYFQTAANGTNGYQIDTDLTASDGDVYSFVVSLDV